MCCARNPIRLALICGGTWEYGQASSRVDGLKRGLSPITTLQTSAPRALPNWLLKTQVVPVKIQLANLYPIRWTVIIVGSDGDAPIFRRSLVESRCGNG